MSIAPFGKETVKQGRRLMKSRELRGRNETYRPGSLITGKRIDPARDKTFLGKVGKVIGATEEFGTRHTLGNLLRMTNPDAMRRLQDRGGPVYASDYMRSLLPTANPILRGLLGFTASILFDPLSYVGGPSARVLKGGVKGFTKGTRATLLKNATRKEGARQETLLRLIDGVGGQSFRMTPAEIRKAQRLSAGAFDKEYAIVGRKKLVGPKGAKASVMEPRFLPKPAAEVGLSPTAVKGTKAQAKKYNRLMEGFQTRAPKDMPSSLAVVRRSKKTDTIRRVFDNPEDFNPNEFAGFVDDYVKSISDLSSSEKATAGISSLLQMSFPFSPTSTIDISGSLEKALRSLRVPTEIAARVGAQARGKMVFAAMDQVREGLRASKAGELLVKHFGFTSLVDPRAVALYHKFHDLLHADVERIGKFVGAHITEPTNKLIDQIAPVLREIDPRLSDTDVRKRLGLFINDLVETGTVVPKGKQDAAYKAFLKRTQENLPELYTSPLLGGPAHFADSEAMANLRNIVRSSNAFNRYVARAEAQAGIPVSELMGDINYMMHAMSDQAKDAYLAARNIPRRRFLKVGKNLADFLRKDMSLAQRSFRNLNENEVLELMETGVEGVEAADLAKILHGVRKDSGFDGRMTRKLQGMLDEGVISEDTFKHAVREIGRKVDPTKSRVEAIDLAVQWNKAGKLDTSFTNDLIHPWTLKEVNEHVWDKGMSTLDIAPKTIREFFTQEPHLQLFLRGQRATRVISEKQYFESMLQIGTKEARDGWVAIPGLERHVEGGEQYLFPKDVAAHFDAYTRYVNDPTPFLNGMMRLNSRALGTWKAWTLAIFPSYHVRNIYGNYWNNTLAGMDYNPITKDGRLVIQSYDSSHRFFNDLARYEAARQVGDKVGMRRAVGSFRKFKVDGKEVNAMQLYKEGQRRGLWDVGFITGDIATGATRELKRHGRELRKVNLAGLYVGLMPTGKGASLWQAGDSAMNPMIETGFRIGGRFENESKMAHFMWRLGKGDSYDEAAMSVKKYLFDYTDLTTFERDVLRKHLIPFYTWTRKNIPLQLEHLLATPERMMRIPKASRATEDALGVYDTPADEKLMAEWMKKAYPVRMRKLPDGRFSYFLLDSWVPAMDLNHLVEWQMTLKSMLSPIPKLFIEQAINQDIRTKRALDVFEDNFFKSVFLNQGERDRVFGKYLPRRVTHPAKNSVRLIRDLDKLFANPDDMTILERLANLFVGRIYPSDPVRGYQEYMRQRREINRSFKLAARSQLRRHQDTKSSDEAVRVYGLKEKALERHAKKVE